MRWFVVVVGAVEVGRQGRRWRGEVDVEDFIKKLVESTNTWRGRRRWCGGVGSGDRVRGKPSAMRGIA